MASLSVARSVLLVAAITLAVCACGSSESAKTVTLSWIAPTTNIDGSPIGTITGYTVYYGPSPTAMTQTIQIADPKATSYLAQHLRPGTYYFSIAASTASGMSARTPPMVTTIP